ncbi:MAG: glycosyltransferase [Lentisphaerae bacterium]|nr:glycosyltransferase [Lentisphaerota bacterium]
MIQVDMHCHSRHSARPSEWFLQKIGTRESYTEVEDVYRLAKARGMDYVTLTDHNTIDGALELVQAHPEDTFVSAEVTTYFPEHDCKIHVLVYDITEAQFGAIQAVRNNIYDLRNLLREADIAYSVAHATYSVNGRLTRDIVEKLILLFNVFEGINGARGRLFNKTWVEVLQDLEPHDIERLQCKHRIDPWGPDAWIKGFTGGSDDHAGLMIGQTYTMAEDASLAELPLRLKSRQTLAGGRHGDHKTLAFAIYKIAYDFSRDRAGNPGSGGFLEMLNTLLFTDDRLGFRNWLAVRKLKRGKDSRDRLLSRFYEDLSAARPGSGIEIEDRINRVYNGLATLSDNFFALIATSVEKDLRNGDAGRLLKNLAAALPALFLIAPFVSTLRHQHQDRELHRELLRLFGKGRLPAARKLLWFSDTMTDLNGVSVTMQELARCAHRTGRPVRLVTTLPEDEARDALPPNTINLPCVYTVTPDFYTAFTLRVPSLLRAIDIIAAESPDEIVVSTPGPVGLTGLAAARLLDIKCTGIYHTDFTRQADHFIGDPSVSAAIESYVRWFFRLMDEVRVPSEAYITMLADRGINPERMRLFRRGIEPGFARGDTRRQAEIRRRHGIPRHAAVLLWAGRLGKEKNLDFLFNVYREAVGARDDVTLLVVGDGPELERLKAEFAWDKRVAFAGRVPRSELPHYYELADLFVFPSTTDTFGMVILEAHACGLPALVTDVGGPQEIVQHGATGWVLPAGDLQAWAGAVRRGIALKERAPEAYRAMRDRARQRDHADYGWERVLDDMLTPPSRDGSAPAPPPECPAAAAPAAAAAAAPVS